jgi:uncharacterized protein YjbI with pentapeptide repeats
LQNLETLDLSNTNISSLDFEGANMFNAFIPIFQGLPNLRNLNLFNNQFRLDEVALSDKFLKYFMGQMRQLSPRIVIT